MVDGVNMTKQTKDSLVRGTIILAAAALVSRILGVLQKVPLQHILGDDGIATYGIAYSVYGLLLIVATAGVPSAISKMVSERYALGKVADAQRIYHAAIWFAVVVGLISTLLLYIAAPFYAERIARDPHAALAIRAIAPALLLFPLIAIMRGYFQGRQMMKANGLSQICEQILRVSTAVGIALLFLYWGYSRATIAAGASFGAVTGAVAALAVMLYFHKVLRRLDEQEGLSMNASAIARTTSLRYRDVYGMLFKVSIPVSIVSLTVPMLYLIDNSTVVALLERQIGYEAALRELGILTGKAQSLAGIPPILSIALSMSIIPVISSAFAKKDYTVVAEQSSLALRISMISGFPIVAILTIAAKSVIGTLFTDAIGWQTASLLTASTMFQIVMMAAGAILLGVDKPKITMTNVMVGIVVKFLGNMLLAPLWGMTGILIATMLCFLVIMSLNLIQLKRIVSFRIMGPRWKGFILSGWVVSLAGYGWVFLFETILELESRFGYLLQAAAISVTIGLLYPICLFSFKVLTSEDIGRFPHKLQKVLMPFQKVLQRSTE